ncbi:lanthionine synthetase LanC family protein [Yoonia sp. GPGPB17]
MRGVWPDLRYHGQTEASGCTEVAWCHGATGIGLARLRAFALTQDPAFLAPAQTAAALTRKTLLTRLTPQTNLCLCHGVCSDIEVFLHPITDDRSVLHEVLDFIKSTYLDAGRPLAYGGGATHKPPGLMLGLAGTGYAVLRCMTTDRPPSLVCIGSS